MHVPQRASSDEQSVVKPLALGVLRNLGGEDDADVLIDVLLGQAALAGWLTRASPILMGSTGERALLEAVDGELIPGALKSVTKEDMIRLADAVLPPETSAKKQSQILIDLMRLLYEQDEHLPERLRDPRVVSESEDKASADFMDPIAGPFALAVCLKEMLVRPPIEYWREDRAGDAISRMSESDGEAS